MYPVTSNNEDRPQMIDVEGRNLKKTAAVPGAATTWQWDPLVKRCLHCQAGSWTQEPPGTRSFRAEESSNDETAMAPFTCASAFATTPGSPSTNTIGMSRVILRA